MNMISSRIDNKVFFIRWWVQRFKYQKIYWLGNC